MDRVKLDPLVADDPGRQGAVEPAREEDHRFPAGWAGARWRSCDAAPFRIVFGGRQRFRDPGMIPAGGARPVRGRPRGTTPRSRACRWSAVSPRAPVRRRESSLIASIACHAPTTPAAAPTMPASAHPGESFREGIRGITQRRQGPSPGTTVSIWPPNRRTPAWTSGRRVTTAASLHRYFVGKLSLPSTTASYLAEQRGGVRRGERLRVHVDRQVRPERPQRRGRGVGLPLPHGVGPVDHLAVEVGDVDPVVVDHPDPPDPRRGEIEEGGRPQPPGAHDEHGRREEPLLPGLPQFLDEDVPAVPQRVFA